MGVTDSEVEVKIENEVERSEKSDVKKGQGRGRK